MGDILKVDMSEPTHGAEPKLSRQWEEQISLVLSESQHAHSHKHMYSSNKCIAGLPTRLPSRPGNAGWAGLPSPCVFS